MKGIVEALVDVRVAEKAAPVLAAFLRDQMRARVGDSAAEPIVADQIVGVRNGSPLLASCVAQILGLPCALFGERVYVVAGPRRRSGGWRVRTFP
jgi:hypothetical protein